jgi:hypothetical protein
MSQTNLEDIANRLQSLERQIIVLKDCYVTLHNSLIGDQHINYMKAVNDA